jgi:hypothetical protein
MNAIFVINQGGFMQPNAHASFEAARLRWAVSLYEIEKLDNPLHPACWKTMLLDYARAHALERILILDADTVISVACPNPFTTFSEHLMVVVSDRQTHAPARDKAEIDEVEIITGQRRKLDNYFNSGMILASVNHHLKLFESARLTCEVWRHLCWHDQTPFNLVCEHQPVLHYADEVWNFLNPAGRIPNWQQMQKHIYHFAGNPDRNKQITETNWRIL